MKIMLLYRPESSQNAVKSLCRLIGLEKDIPEGIDIDSMIGQAKVLGRSNYKGIAIQKYAIIKRGQGSTIMAEIVGWSYKRIHKRPCFTKKSKFRGLR